MKYSKAALDYLARHAIDPARAAALGVGEQPAGTLTYPGGRCRPLGGNRTLQPAGQPLAPWWAVEPQDDPTALVCEGEPDALAAATHLPATAATAALHGYGIGAVPGTGYPPARLASDLAEKQVVTALLAMDGDEAGRKAATRYAAALDAAGIRPLIVPIHDGQDLADVLAADSPASTLEALIADASPSTPSANGRPAEPSRYDEQTGKPRPLLDLIRSKLADDRGELPVDRKLMQIVKRGRERPSYELHLANGEYAGPLTAAQLLKPGNVRAAMLVAAGRAVPPVGTREADWTRVAEWIDEAAEIADTVRESEETREWLASFLEIEDPAIVPTDDASRLARQLRDGPRDTFRDPDGRVYLKLTPLSPHVRIHLGAKTTRPHQPADPARLQGRAAIGPRRGHGNSP